MNKEEFLDVDREDWWLVDRAADPALQQLKEQLGAALGYGSETDWYTRPDRLEPLWEIIEQRADLAAQLQEAVDDDRRKVWVEAIVETRQVANPAAEHPVAAQAAPPVAPTSADEPAAPAVAKRSLFAKKDRDDGPDDGASTQVDPAAEAGPTEPAAPRSLFARKPAAQTDVAASAEAGSGGPASAGPIEVEHVDVEELKGSISDLLEDPGIDLSAADVDQLAADPDFDRKLAEATAALRAEAAAEDGDDLWDEDEDEEELEPAGES